MGVYMSAKEEIIRFINNPVHTGAYILNGSWGSGKTYLIEEVINEVNSNDTHYCIRVSLFGLNDRKILERIIKEQLIKAKFKITDNSHSNLYEGLITIVKTVADGIKGINTVAKIVSNMLNVNFFDFIEITNELEVVGEEKSRKVVLIFDDFERSKFDYKELLGIINHFVENKGIIVCIIMDESKVDGSEYHSFKEKVVERQSYIDNISSEVIENIIREAYSNTEFGEFLNSIFDSVFRVFSESRTNNYRILKSGLNYFSEIYPTLQRIEFDQEELKSFFVSFMAFFFEFKSNRFKISEAGGKPYFSNLNMYKTKEDEQDGISVSYTEFDSNFRIQAVESWVRIGSWNEDTIINELESIKAALHYTPKLLERSVFELDDDLILNELPDVLEKGYSGELNQRELMKLLGLLWSFKNIKYDCPVPVDFRKLNEGYTLREEKLKTGTISETASNMFLEPKMLETLGPEAIALHSRIFGKDDRREAWITRNRFIAYLSDLDRAMLNRGYSIPSFDDELLVAIEDAFTKASNDNKYNICYELQHVLVSNLYITTEEDLLLSIKNLEIFIDWLKEQADYSKKEFEKAVINVCVDNMNDLLKKCQVDLKTNNYK